MQRCAKSIEPKSFSFRGVSSSRNTTPIPRARAISYLRKTSGANGAHVCRLRELLSSLLYPRLSPRRSVSRFPCFSSSGRRCNLREIFEGRDTVRKGKCVASNSDFAANWNCRFAPGCKKIRTKFNVQPEKRFIKMKLISIFK